MLLLIRSILYEFLNSNRIKIIEAWSRGEWGEFFDDPHLQRMGYLAVFVLVCRNDQPTPQAVEEVMMWRDGRASQYFNDIDWQTRMQGCQMDRRLGSRSFHLK